MLTLIEPEAPAPRTATLPSRRHVLLADDNAVFLAAVSGLLRLMGHRVDVARDGIEAAEAVARSDYDLVLLDIQMPGMDGREVAGLIPRGGPRVVAITGDAASVEAGPGCLFDAVLAKPLRAGELAWQLGEAGWARPA